MAVITCRKCGVTVKYTDVIPDECATCGAVFVKIGAPPDVPGWKRPSQPPEAVPASRSTAPPRQPFIVELREHTHYPAFRSVIAIFAVVLYIVAALVAVAGIISNHGAAMILSIVGAAVLVIFTRFGKEASLMLADLSDAAVFTAERARRNQDSV